MHQKTERNPAWSRMGQGSYEYQAGIHDYIFVYYVQHVGQVRASPLWLLNLYYVEHASAHNAIYAARCYIPYRMLFRCNVNAPSFQCVSTIQSQPHARRIIYKHRRAENILLDRSFHCIITIVLYYNSRRCGADAADAPEITSLQWFVLVYNKPCIKRSYVLGTGVEIFFVPMHFSWPRVRRRTDL